MRIFNQPFDGSLGDRLINFLDSSDYKLVNIIVAFAKNSGVLRIKDALDRFRKRGGTVNIFVGVDLGGTSYEALSSLFLHVDSLYVVHSERAQTFHTKIYDFVGDEEALIIVGSHNLTSGGLWTNFESSVFLPVSWQSSNDSDLQREVENYIKQLVSLAQSVMKISSQNDIDGLLDGKYVLKEITARICRINGEVNAQKPQKLFGNGVHASLPRLNSTSKSKVADPSQIASGRTEADSRLIAHGEVTDASQGPDSLRGRSDDPTIWFESRAMTGGSRNILDLSMKSLVEHGDPLGTPYEHIEEEYMKGGVEFFGVDPQNTATEKEVILNFDGIDYQGNTIKYPQGSKANGTWRLQIKGIDSSNRKITDAFKAKNEDNTQREYLQNKIIAFTKVSDGYYFLSVFPEEDLEVFEQASWLWGYNGATDQSKRMGLLKND